MRLQSTYLHKTGVEIDWGSISITFHKKVDFRSAYSEIVEQFDELHTIPYEFPFLYIGAENDRFLKSEVWNFKQVDNLTSYSGASIVSECNDVTW